VPIGLISKDEIRAKLEDLGVAQVRLLLANGGLPLLWQPTIIEWLARKDQEEQREKEAREASQSKLNQSALKAAWIGVAIAIAVDAVTALAWVLPHLWG
jgi:hypothetical protein